MPSSPANEDGGGEAAVDEQRHEQQPRAPDAPVAPPPAEPDALAAMEDRYKRSLADLDNYRKRSARELDRRVAESRESMLRDWLEALDSIERALRMDPDGPASPGLRAVLEQMEAILARYGVQRVGAPGEEFDPERHEAIGVRTTEDAPDRSVLEVARSGFALGDRVLRPAQVVVARAGAPAG
jgi:molecular chaperone GrpE